MILNIYKVIIVIVRGAEQLFMVSRCFRRAGTWIPGRGQLKGKEVRKSRSTLYSDDFVNHGCQIHLVGERSVP